MDEGTAAIIGLLIGLLPVVPVGLILAALALVAIVIFIIVYAFEQPFRC